MIKKDTLRCIPIGVYLIGGHIWWHVLERWWPGLYGLGLVLLYKIYLSLVLSIIINGLDCQPIYLRVHRILSSHDSVRGRTSNKRNMDPWLEVYEDREWFLGHGSTRTGEHTWNLSLGKPHPSKPNTFPTKLMVGQSWPYFFI